MVSDDCKNTPHIWGGGRTAHGINGSFKNMELFLARQLATENP